MDYGSLLQYRRDENAGLIIGKPVTDVVTKQRRLSLARRKPRISPYLSFLNFNGATLTLLGVWLLIHAGIKIKQC